ncbi:Fibronectin type III domain protein [Cellulophaga algicola DSM 14237]|uniref:Fibronectin type III domain protein n=1 Tax=Cellulophaga algicola (strain DSM 14237 / IC166 / ACAM 630) TaxID=688270 RepID=E6X452_CELAD|nr:fibronectin type III domain-containing protein [Cellulophaga algicola]ADV50394.1 Fibronectin type III domain protein [Cellulophaga algicola DSM 14237]
MKYIYSFLIFLLVNISLIAQNLHTESNAVSSLNEGNSTTGWTGLAQLFSEATDVQNGSFSFRAVSTATDGRTVDYNFNAVVGQQYVIRIWAKIGAQSNPSVSPAFAVWSGVSGFNVTPITGTTWSEYVFNVTATTTNPRIRIYVSNYSFRFVAGNTIYIDNVSITALDNQAPTVPTNLSANAITATSTNLSWTSATDNVAVTNYEVFQNGISIGLTNGNTTFAVSNLNPQTTYTYTVTALDNSNNSSAQSESITITTIAALDTEVPTAPSGLVADNITTTSVNLNWTAATDNVGVTDYEIFQEGVSIGVSNGNISFPVTGLTPETTYNFTVVALDAAANVSAQSESIAVLTLAVADTEVPTAPSGLVADNITTTSVNLNWTAATDNIGVTDYEIFQEGVSIGLSNGNTSFPVNGLTPETTYNFTVAALDAAANVSAQSESIAVLTLAVADTEVPTAPSGLVANNITTSSVNLNWTAATDNIGVTDYEIFQEGVSIGVSNGNISFPVNALTPETTYNFTVVALDAAANVSAQSTGVTVLTLVVADTEVPTAPSGLVADNITSTSVNLNWTAATDNVGVIDYEIFQEGVSIGLSNGNTSFPVNGLTPETTYNFTVAALDAAANVSAQSESIVVLTLAVSDTTAPSIPVGLISGNTTTTSIEISWDAATDNVEVTDYEIFQDGVSIGLTGGNSNFLITNLTAETTYVFTIAALDAANNVSIQSSELSVSTQAEVLPTIAYTSLNSNLNTVDWTVRDLYANQNVGIGTTDTQGYRLAVAGNVVAEEVKVALQVNWPDYVFDKKYELPSLEQVEKYINENGYLMHMPSASEVEENGILIGEMNAKLLRKIEELTLYTITQEKKIKLLEQQVEAIQQALLNK